MSASRGREQDASTATDCQRNAIIQIRTRDGLFMFFLLSGDGVVLSANRLSFAKDSFESAATFAIAHDD